MNERIRELARESGIKMIHQNALSLGYLDTAHKKFAKLIVQECVRHFNEDYKRDFMVSWREDLSNSILNHFGIKE